MLITSIMGGADHQTSGSKDQSQPRHVAVGSRTGTVDSFAGEPLQVIEQEWNHVGWNVYFSSTLFCLERPMCILPSDKVHACSTRSPDFVIGLRRDANVSDGLRQSGFQYYPTPFVLETQKGPISLRAWGATSLGHPGPGSTARCGLITTRLSPTSSAARRSLRRGRLLEVQWTFLPRRRGFTLRLCFEQ